MVCASTADLIQDHQGCLESIRICWGYKYLAPTLQGAPRRRVKALNGISGLHSPRYIGRVTLRVHTILGECGLSHLSSYRLSQRLKSYGGRIMQG